MAEFAQGGLIPGPLTDSLPILVERGYVIAPSSLVKRYGAEFLALLNGSADTEVIAIHE